MPQVGWTSVKQYYTYTWALVPEGYTEGTSVNFCALFQGKKHFRECDTVNNSIDLLDILSVPSIADSWVSQRCALLQWWKVTLSTFISKYCDVILSYLYFT